MRITLINITGGGISGGYKKYLQNILPRLVDDEGIKSVLCATPEALKIKDWIEPSDKIRHITCNKYKPFLQWMDFKLKAEIYKFSPDIIFIPVERPFSFRKVNVVNMLQTMEPFVPHTKGNPLDERLIQYLQYFSGKKAIKNATKVIALSKFVAEFMNSKWSIPKNKIHLVYHGNDSICDRTVKPPTTISCSGSKFLFTAGSIRPARGLEDLLGALLMLVLNGNKSIKLVIAGSISPRMDRYFSKLQHWIKINGLQSNVVWVGNLIKSEMAWCFQRCEAFIMSSRVESFGMIAGEAMANGAVCISANNPCLPEIFNNIAFYYEPLNSKDLSNIIQRVLSLKRHEREVIAKKAVLRSKQFSWDICAHKTIDCLMAAVKDYC